MPVAELLSPDLGEARGADRLVNAAFGTSGHRIETGTN
jgi:hypothetical protein